MFSVLPDLTPRDVSYPLTNPQPAPPSTINPNPQSHSLWYTSTRNPNLTPSHLDPNLHSGDNTFPGGVNGPPGGANQTNGPRNNRPQAQQATIERSVLGRLRADELYMERRRANVGNLGSTWLNLPGVNKTLFQLREESSERRNDLSVSRFFSRERLGGGALVEKDESAVPVRGSDGSKAGSLGSLVGLVSNEVRVGVVVPEAGFWLSPALRCRACFVIPWLIPARQPKGDASAHQQQRP